MSAHHFPRMVVPLAGESMRDATIVSPFRVSFLGQSLAAEAIFPPPLSLRLEASEDRKDLFHFVADFALPHEVSDVSGANAAAFVTQQYGLHCRALPGSTSGLRISVIERLTVTPPEDGPSSARLLALSTAGQALALLDGELANGTFVDGLLRFLRNTGAS